jgi:tetratricopeptide (TPR) repeat protein
LAHKARRFLVFGRLLVAAALTLKETSVRLAEMARSRKSAKRSPSRSRNAPSRGRKLLKNKEEKRLAAHAEAVRQMVDPQFEHQLKIYEQAVQQFQQQKLLKAKELLEKVLTGPSKELADRAQVHLRIIEQRLAKQPAPSLRTPEEHYQAGVAMMNLGRWDEAREHLLRAKKLAPKADYVFYAMAALDCLTGEAESAMENLKVAIQLRPENRYHARNDEDFAFLQEDPRFTELLYPEREASGG